MYLPPNDDHVKATDVERPDDVPTAALPDEALGFRVQAYGLTTWADLFTNRQLTALTTLSDLAGEARERVEKDAVAAGRSSQAPGNYADAVATYLALVVSRTTDQSNNLARWSVSRDQSIGLFARQAIPMVWDFPEVNPFARAAGDFGVAVNAGAKAIRALRPDADEMDR